MAGITQPFNFRRFITCAPQSGFDFVPFLDALAIAFFVALNVSAFVIAPGTTIQLPESSAMQASQAAPTAVLTVDRNDLYFFEGAKLSALTLESHLRGHIEDLEGSDREIQPTLLIKADSSISTDSLFKLMDIARRVGFVRVHLAAEPSLPESGPGWTSAPGTSLP